MRAAGTKSSLVKIPKEETKVTTSDLLPQGDWKTAVVVDAMHAIYAVGPSPSQKMRHVETLLVATRSSC